MDMLGDLRVVTPLACEMRAGRQEVQYAPDDSLPAVS
jgi:hypothetical protein